MQNNQEAWGEPQVNKQEFFAEWASTSGCFSQYHSGGSFLHYGVKIRSDYCGFLCCARTKPPANKQERCVWSERQQVASHKTGARVKIVFHILVIASAMAALARGFGCRGRHPYHIGDAEQGGGENPFIHMTVFCLAPDLLPYDDRSDMLIMFPGQKATFLIQVLGWRSLKTPGYNIPPSYKYAVLKRSSNHNYLISLKMH